MHRPVLFIARSWPGHGGMQRLNRDVALYVGGARHGFTCIHPVRRTIGSRLSFVFRSIFAAIGHRGMDGRVHVGDMAALPLAVVSAWLGNMKLSVTACGLDVIYPKRFYQWMIRRCLRHVDHVICISNATADEVRRRGVGDDRITVIPCGIAPSSAAPNADRDPHFLLTVGRLVKRKGVAWFLEHVFPFLLQDFPDLHYAIVGDGPERKMIERLIRELALTDAVYLFPSASDANRQELLSTASLFIAPNIHVKQDMEGFGIVCIEAAAAGLPVVASNIQGLKDAVIDGKTGMFFEACDPADCTRVIKQLITHPLNANAVHDVVIHRFGWDTLAPHYHDVFDR